MALGKTRESHTDMNLHAHWIILAGRCIFPLALRRRTMSDDESGEVDRITSSDIQQAIQLLDFRDSSAVQSERYFRHFSAVVAHVYDVT